MIGRRHIPLALALVALGAAAIVVAVLVIGGGGGSTDRASERPSEEGLAGEFAEETEQARGREEALEQARREGTLGLTEPLAVKAAPGWRGERVWRERADDWEPAVAGRPGFTARIHADDALRGQAGLRARLPGSRHTAEGIAGRGPPLGARPLPVSLSRV